MLQTKIATLALVAIVLVLRGVVPLQAAEKLPAQLSLAEFKAIVQQVASGSDLGNQEGSLPICAMFEGKDKCVYRFQKATVGTVSRMSINEYLESSHLEACTTGAFFKDLEGPRGIVLGVMSYDCSKTSQKGFLGFGLIKDDQQKASQLFWIRGNGPGLTDAAGQSALIRLFDALKTKYVGQ